MSAQMTALEGKAPDGSRTRCVLRCPGEAQLIQNPATIENEYRVLLLGQALGLPMPAPLLFLPPGAEFSAACLVMKYVEGGLDFSPAHLEDYLAQMAGALAQIHAATCAKAGLDFLPRQESAILEALPEVATPADLPSSPIHAALQAFSPPAPANPSAMLHGDYWPGNLLWQNGRLQAVIDWEDASLGDPLIDLGIARLEVVWMFGPPVLPLFTQAYVARNRLDFSALPYWDLYAALRLSRLVDTDLAAWAASFAPQGRADLTASVLAERFDWFVKQALAESDPLRRPA
ncbi:MAG: phosphotransferase [Anaerolineaceae bacterium]|nr:phosphotransferase [Anaerolineaceae bacterium]